ncbi:hypothetical protein BGX38DRAFT_1269645 [Terfezia claveryi]|nr:hypothetical protein BGX38DRAFT_1269645 [Terfezia claveryi]
MSSSSILGYLTGTGIDALQVPEIRKHLKTPVTYKRTKGIMVEARRANKQDNEVCHPTYITDRTGRLLSPRINSKNYIYTEWYMTEKDWYQVYSGHPTDEFIGYPSISEVVKSGLLITAEVIGLLDGQDGRAEIKTPSGLKKTMWALEDRLLTEEGPAIGPQILAIYCSTELFSIIATWIFICALV